MTRARVETFHRRSLEDHGGQDGIRNEHGLESALAQPMNVYFYGQGDLYDMAAAYAYHLAENQPFIDGNKRTAMATTFLFLAGNRRWWQAESEDVRAHVAWIAASDAAARDEVLHYMTKYFSARLVDIDLDDVPDLPR